MSLPATAQEFAAIGVWADSGAVEGEGWVASSAVTVELTHDATTTTWTPATDEFGYFQIPDAGAVAGDLVVVGDGSATKSMTVIDLDLRVDPAAGPATAVVVTTSADVDLFVYADDEFGSSAMRAVPTPTPADGTPVDFADDPLAEEYGQLSGSVVRAAANSNDPDGDGTNLQWRPPDLAFAVQPPSDVWSMGQDWSEGTTVTMTADDPATAHLDYTASMIVERWGPEPWEVGFHFYSESFEILPGYEVTVSDGTDSKTLIVVDVVVEGVDPLTDAVWGHAPAGVQVEVDGGNEEGGAHRSVHADDATGSWMADFSTPGSGEYEQETLDLRPGVGGAAQVFDADGDATVAGWCVECGGPPSGPIDAEPGDVLISQTDGSLWVYEPDTGGLTQHGLPFGESFGGMWDIQWFDHDHLLIANSGDARIWMFEMSTGHLEPVAEGAPLGFPIGLALEQDRATLWIADHVAGVLRMDLTTGGIEQVVEPFGSPIDGIVVIDGTVYFTDQSSTVWQVDDGAPGNHTTLVDVGTYRLNGLVETPTGDLLATATWPPALVTIELGTLAVSVRDYADEMRSSEDAAFAANRDVYVSDSGFFDPEFGIDPGLYLAPSSGGELIELHRGDPLGDIVDLLVVGSGLAVTSVIGPSAPVLVGTSVTVQAAYVDPNPDATHTAWFDWGDGTSDTADITATDGGGTVEASHSYAEPGVYAVTAAVDDGLGTTATDEFRDLVVYDPGSGFVTGGGWFWSPAGAYPAQPDVEGKVSFGFVSRYKNGAHVPTGSAEFQFHAAGFEFRSSSYEWLVVAGHEAKLMGSGAVGHQAGYGFMLSATDDDFDALRLQIWDETSGEVLYDNAVGTEGDSDDGTRLGGGSIVIHRAKGS